jgi:hypothetical protein
MFSLFLIKAFFYDYDELLAKKLYFRYRKYQEKKESVDEREEF